MPNCKANLYKSNIPQIIFFIVVDEPTPCLKRSMLTYKNG